MKTIIVTLLASASLWFMVSNLMIGNTPNDIAVLVIISCLTVVYSFFTNVVDDGYGTSGFELFFIGISLFPLLNLTLTFLYFVTYILYFFSDDRKIDIEREKRLSNSH